MDELNVGDRIQDNDPRSTYRVLTIVEILPNGVAARNLSGRVFRILRRRIYTDGKLRRGGFSRVEEDPERAWFEAWLMDVHMLDATWNVKRNCYDEFPAHLAFQAWRAARAEATGRSDAQRDIGTKATP